jgi:hypothetical protein
MTARPMRPTTDLSVCWVAIVLHEDQGSDCSQDRGCRTAVQNAKLVIKGQTMTSSTPALLYRVVREGQHASWQTLLGTLLRAGTASCIDSKTRRSQGLRQARRLLLGV